MHTALREIPEISTTTDGTIVVELSPEHAVVLAKVLIHYDVLLGTAQPGTAPADGYEPDVWHHTFIRLLTEQARWRDRLGALTAVPNLTTALDGGHLR